MASSSQVNQYKTLVLRVGFDERHHGYINPFEDIIQDNIPEYTYDNRNNYKPVPFHPTNPEPNYPVYQTNIKIEKNNVAAITTIIPAIIFPIFILISHFLFL